jgi:hypothetical protein
MYNIHISICDIYNTKGNVFEILSLDRLPILYYTQNIMFLVYFMLQGASFLTEAYV